ncbi:pilus assembly protein PilY [Acinetobacter ursingii]|uniref:pilus assembly protein PilY n=1 Tax=Acinetobacter ursingii TaxID=108980 RepID=UPI0024481272|nr:pilus assembly protein PilY [Acinetobacter ursingii]MDG9949679.1 pilus assembly protein PilY [Acinetobacter ursingii]MDH2019478.1 pilus assembly protein PilY [Acinetobacter ursingii]MDH2071264.1 pilus assembly protein PilY [Acinetobacter ursingii]
MKNLNQKLLSTAVSMLMTVSICHVAVTQASDIEIYKLPDQTKLGIFMMLDISGSMDLNYYIDRNNSSVGPCDLPSGVTSGGRVTGEISANGYTKNFCRVGGTQKYYYWDNTSGSGSSKGWYQCSAITNTPTTSRCTKMTSPASPSNANLVGLVKDSNNYYYKYDGATQYYDRISRLNDALYTLANSSDIPPKTQIGVGMFSYNGDGNRGYVVIKADEWGAVGSAQRQKLIDLVQGGNVSGDGVTPTAAAYAESAAYLLGTTTGGGAYSGIGVSGAASGITSGTGSNMKYISPLDKVTDPKCSGKGIYFLTDGEPNGAGGASTVMQKALNLTSYNTTGGMSNTGAVNGTAAAWEFIGSFAKYLNNGTYLQPFFNSNQRNDQHVIKTAVVGFGSVFDIADPTGQIRKTLTDPKTGKVRTYYNCSKLTGTDRINACNWGMKSKFSDGTTTIAGSGGYGEGGFYSASNTSDVVKSFTNFVDDMKPEFDPVPTGSPTIPVDALNPIQLQPYGYYASFTPKPQETYQLWLGNLNKYYIYNGQLYDSTKTIQLIMSSGKLDETAKGIWGANTNGGVVGQLPLGTAANGTSSKRTVYTNRKINASNVAEEADSLQSVNLNTLFATGTDGKFRNDARKNYWLNILGYNVDINATGLTVATLPTAERRQLGAVMHSKPVLLTQEGKVVATNGVVSTTGRKDYLLFGSTQGSLHVVKVGSDTDTDRGQEVFTFVPNEMIENKPQAFLSENAVSGGRDNLFYGIDGAWTAYTQYVSKSDNTFTVNSSDRVDSSGKDLEQKGLQWVYGGLRMGGQSYYALDLTNIDNPSLKFHIDPKNQKVISSSTTKTFSPLQYMGDSWSKPTIAWVNWGGVRTPVMFVGGGYDEGYEAPDYDQDNNTTTPKRGAGVYMFDARNGDLLWWSSANVGTSTSTTTNSGTIATKDANLKYSVVSQINAVDRDGDGLVDHLFFGDLGGQAFRIDLNNKASTLGAFAKRIVRLYNAHVASGASPRFYEMPSFSVHSGVDGLFGVLALSSGNRSSPLAGVHRINGSDVTTVTADDGVYVIYDNDVARSDLYNDTALAKNPLRTSPANLGVSLKNATFTDLKNGIPQKDSSGKYNGGWFYQYPVTQNKGQYKGMNEIYALDGMLYVNVYNKDGTGIMGDCGSGVIGDTELYQFCLPTGKCSFYTTNSTGPNKIVLGGGILGTGLGLGYSNKSDEMSIIKGKEGSDCTQAANKNKPECQLFDTGARLQHLRWYESR